MKETNSKTVADRRDRALLVRHAKALVDAGFAEAALVQGRRNAMQAPEHMAADRRVESERINHASARFETAAMRYYK